MKFTWDLIIANFEDFSAWSAIIKSRENKLSPTKIQCKQCNEKDHMDSIFVLLSNTVHEFREKLFPRIKSETQMRDFFPAKPEKS